MPIRYRIDRERGVVFVAGEGAVDFADLEAYCRGVVEDPDYRPGLHELADFRKVDDWSVPTEDLHKLRDVNQDVADKVGSSRLAYVMPNDFGFGIGRMFMAISGESKVEHRVFRDMAEARAWLGLPSEEAGDGQPE